MLTRDALLTRLKAEGISYEITHHPAVFNMAEVAQIELPYLKSTPKIFLCVTISVETTT